MVIVHSYVSLREGVYIYIYIYMYMYVDNLTEEKDWDLGLQNGHLNWCKLAQHRIQWLGEWENPGLYHHFADWQVFIYTRTNSKAFGNHQNEDTNSPMISFSSWKA